ncbi:cytochrome P450 [Phascolomyces articulosus]|uniref:Cytochrome P450 n=1 Tax=Phascolomyces articulosus TaxID=60185 RepID=A0AAD5P8T8_9FUNG|nr:cytochrome P450 [Phascolomyces articulosus]
MAELSPTIDILKTFIVEHRWWIRFSIGVFSLHFLYNKITQPPASLRHIPHADFFALIKAIRKHKQIDDIAHEITFPTVANSTHGLYARFDNLGWTVHVTDPGIVKTILKSDAFPKSVNSIHTRRGTLAGRLLLGPNILFLSGEQWKNQRKVINPAFHRSMPVQIFGRVTQKMLNTMETEMKSDHDNDDVKPIDVHDISQRWALDVLGESAFGFQFNALDSNGEDNEWVTRYNHIVQSAQKPLYFLLPSIERQFKSWIPERRKAHQELSKFLDMMSSIADHKRQALLNKKASSLDKNDHEKDLLTLMVEAEHEGQGRLTDEEFLSNLSVFFLAGHETTAAAVSFAIYYLAVHPEIQQKAREEVLGIFGDDPHDILPTLEQTRELDYINRVIKETLRMDPPAVSMVARTATKDTELSGVFIPKGTRLTVDVYELHRNPRIWNNPNQFDPERFAPGGEAEQLSATGLPWVAFSNGARTCIGMSFSLLEQRVSLSMLLRKYEWSLPEDSIHKDKILTSGVGVIKPKDLFIKFTKRY